MYMRMRHNQCLIFFCPILVHVQFLLAADRFCPSLLINGTKTATSVKNFTFTQNQKTILVHVQFLLVADRFCPSLQFYL